MTVYVVLHGFTEDYNSPLIDYIEKVFWTEEVAKQYCSWNEDCYYEEWEVSDEQ